MENEFAVSLNHYLDNCRLVRDRIYKFSNRMLKEGENGPSNRSEHGGSAD